MPARRADSAAPAKSFHSLALVQQHELVHRPRHPAPGAPYKGTSRTAYYPDNSLGWRCVALLRLAFEPGARLAQPLSAAPPRSLVSLGGPAATGMCSPPRRDELPVLSKAGPTGPLMC